MRHQETHCPFCGDVLDPVEAATRIVPDTNLRLGRAAAFVFGATVALAACSGDTVVGEDDGGSESSASSTSSGSSSSSSHSAAAIYGGPTTTTGGMGGAGGTDALYGSPPTGGFGGAGG